VYGVLSIAFLDTAGTSESADDTLITLAFYNAREPGEYAVVSAIPETQPGVIVLVTSAAGEIIGGAPAGTVTLTQITPRVAGSFAFRVQNGAGDVIEASGDFNGLPYN